MNLKLIVLSLLGPLLTASVAFGQDSQCLERASNRDLVREIETRMSGGTTPPSSGGFVIAFVCGGNAEVKITTTDLTTGASKEGSTRTGDWESRRSMASMLNSKIGNVTLFVPKIIAVCGGNAEVIRTMISATEIKRISSISTGDWNTCRQQAEEINKNLSK